MSKIISDLLQAKEPLFSVAIRQLEDISGKPGNDVRLSSEIIGKVQQKIVDLNLDPKDTTGAELYHSLILKMVKDSEILAKTIGVNSDSNCEESLRVIKNIVEQQDIKKQCWVIKKSVAKELLKTLPPKNIMKIFNCRSIDNLLKNENIFEVFGALRFVESSEWLKRFIKNYKNLKPSDFEERDIEILIMPPERWADTSKEFVSKKMHNVTHLKELGAIIILPSDEQDKNKLTITVLSLLLHYINEIRLYSSYFKLQQVKSNFASIFIDTLIADPKKTAVIANQHIHWRTVQRYYGKLKAEKHPEIFEPHLQPEDLHWRKAEHTLFEIDPQLGWWRDLDFVGVIDKKEPVSLNLIDCVINWANNNDYNNRIYYHFRESLWNEVFIRYMGERTIENQILKQLDNDMVKPENLKISYKEG